MTYIHEVALAAKAGLEYTVAVPFHTSTIGKDGIRVDNRDEILITVPPVVVPGQTLDELAQAWKDKETFCLQAIINLKMKYKDDPYFRVIYTIDKVVERLMVGLHGT